ncbi:MAG: hypothetical protein ABIU54_01120 [Candidatus Eisenbacteria bacterium]
MRRYFLAFPVFLLLASLAALVLTPQMGVTVPLYAARTGLMCQSCHFDPNGGGPRNEFGFAFAKNRHSLEPETEGDFKDMTLTNRVSDTFPLYVGVNQRLMLLANNQVKDSGVDRLGFFNMENALHFTFQPHARLTLVYSRDGFNEGSSNKEAFGMIGLPADMYLKAGQFRVPFGLRMDDHTVATRNSFLDFQSGARFLPYDPRRTDRGLELGGTRGSLFGRVAYTNGMNDPFQTTNSIAHATTAKLGVNSPHYQGGYSIYDDFHREADILGGPGTVGERRTRWGYYGLAHVGKFAFIAEAAAGTDRLQTLNLLTGLGEITEVNRLAYFAEANYTASRECNVRVRYDYLDTANGSSDAVAELNQYRRYALEGEYMPVPFAEVRWTLRLIDPVAEKDLSDTEIKNEKQAYVQLHFSY